MNKDKINSKIEDLEAELQKLKELAQEPEQRTPEQRTPETGDVWSKGGCDYLILSDGYQLIGGKCGAVKMKIEPNPWVTLGYTYLGKFDEVYVKISDVRDALDDATDSHGDTLISCGTDGTYFQSTGSKKLVESLRNLGIIAE